MKIKKLAPVLIVDRIEPVLPLWDALGFRRTVEVPHGEGLGFVILERDGIEVMVQTRDSVAADEPHALEGPHPVGAAALFIEVDDLDAMVKALPQGTDVVNARRQTFYGSTETIFRDAAGNVITFAQMA
jgi:uncharacterized glyoxalase superfamily protein PhnB